MCWWYQVSKIRDKFYLENKCSVILKCFHLCFYICKRILKANKYCICQEVKLSSSENSRICMYNLYINVYKFVTIVIKRQIKERNCINKQHNFCLQFIQWISHCACRNSGVKSYNEYSRCVFKLLLWIHIRNFTLF